jgi:hypothetical protein
MALQCVNGACEEVYGGIGNCNACTTPAPACTSFTANPSSISSGQNASLSWICSDAATSCSIDNGIGAVEAPAGSLSVTPSRTTTYNLSCTGTGGTATVAATVTVMPPSSTPPPSGATASIAGIQGDNAGIITNGTVVPGTSIILYGTFGSSGNTVAINGTDVTKNIIYQGPAGNPTAAAPNQINVSIPASASWLMTTQGNSVTVTTALPQLPWRNLQLCFS